MISTRTIAATFTAARNSVGRAIIRLLASTERKAATFRPGGRHVTWLNGGHPGYHGNLRLALRPVRVEKRRR